MKVIVVDREGNNLIIKNYVPRIGDTVNLGYKPYPMVATVLWKPPQGMLPEQDDVLVIVE